MPGPQRDLAHHDLWQTSLARSFERRGLSPARARTRFARDLAAGEPWRESAERSSRRRAARERQLAFAGGRRVAVPATVLTAAFTAGELVVPVGGGVAQAAKRTLEKGDEGRSVRALQRLLGLQPDGVFGPATKRAVKRFQRRAGLTADGVVGPATWAALRARQSARRAPATGDGEVRSRGAAVARLQRALGVGADGVFGPATERAVKRFQRKHGLTADGVVGPATWRALGLRSRVVLKRDRDAAGGERPRREAAVDGSRADRLVARMVAAGDRIATKPYRYGGGHGRWRDSGYDCSGSISYVLHAAGLLDRARDSSGFMSWGRKGKGRRVTIYAHGGHAFMVIDGRRFDTSAMRETGSRWTTTMRSTKGYVARHPAGL